MNGPHEWTNSMESVFLIIGMSSYRVCQRILTCVAHKVCRSISPSWELSSFFVFQVIFKNTKQNPDKQGRGMVVEEGDGC